MHTNAYKSLVDNMIVDLDIDEFNFINKLSKKLKRSKVALGMAYTMLLSALFFGSSEAGFTIIVAGLVLIFYFQNKIKHYTEVIAEKKENFVLIIEKYICSDKIKNYRQAQSLKLKNKAFSKMEYLDIIKEEIHLIFALIKKECVQESSIDIVTYKKSIEDLFSVVNSLVEDKLLEKEEVDAIKRKWSSDVQALCNQYAKTDLEVELKYLNIKAKDIN